MDNSSKSLRFIVLTSLSAFSVYSCMYAFRKAFSVGVFDDLSYLGVEYKSWLIIAQAIGYMISKFIGIKIISELSHGSRAYSILLLIAFAELALIGFAFIPPPYNIGFLLLNGLPLGMIWGIVFSYLEGRSTTEILGAILATSFIIASNIAKSVAQWLIIDFSISEYHAPYLVGLIFSIPLIIAVKMLDQTPPPTAEDEATRLKRVPMSAEDRSKGFGVVSRLIILLVFNYLLLTIFRDLRSNYSSDIFLALGYAKTTSVYLSTTIPMTLIVLLIMGSIFLIRTNMKALLVIQLMVIFGYLVVAMSTYLFQINQISGLIWVVAIGTGTYISYIPFNCFVFERLIPAFNLSGSNIGFFMYIADAFGYLGSVGVLLAKNLLTPDLKWFDFIILMGYWVAAIGITISIMALFQFKKSQHNHRAGYSSPEFIK